MFGSSAKADSLISKLAAIESKMAELKDENAELKKANDSFAHLVRKQEEELKELRFQTKHMKETLELEHDKKVMSIQREMQKALVSSDLTRVEALAKLEVYEKTDTKSDANAIKEMIGKLIDQLGKQQAPASINVVK
jgi:phage-related protein